MCPCRKDYFQDSEVKYLKHFIHFHCKCETEDHEYFVNFWSSHPYGTTIPQVVDNDIVQKKCYCKIIHANTFCEFCSQVSYFFVGRVKSFFNYLEQLDCDLFFYLKIIGFK